MVEGRSFCKCPPLPPRDSAAAHRAALAASSDGGSRSVPAVQERRRDRAGSVRQSRAHPRHPEAEHGGLGVPPERRLHQPSPGGCAARRWRANAVLPDLRRRQALCSRCARVPCGGVEALGSELATPMNVSLPYVTALDFQHSGFAGLSTVFIFGWRNDFASSQLCDLECALRLSPDCCHL